MRSLLLLAPCLAGCGAALWPEIVDTRSLGAGGTPEIQRLRDLGTVVVPSSGALRGDSDGVASPGELLLIEGRGLGRQPTVTVDRRPAEVLARTSGGGIVVRVPVAITVGQRRVEVMVGDGRAAAELAVRRHALVAHGGEVSVVALTDGAPRLLGKHAVPGAQTVRVAPDGSSAYVLGNRKLVVLDLGAAGGPQIVDQREVPFAAHTLLVAERAPLLILLGEERLQAFEIQVGRHPAAYPPQPLPKELHGRHRTELSPDGAVVAFMLPEGNRIALLDVARPKEPPRHAATVAVLPGEQVPLLVDLAFGSDGETIWALAGDNLASLVIGTQPSRLVALRRGDGEGRPFAPWRTFPLGESGPPLRLLAARAAPPASGATIRLAPERTRLLIAAATTASWGDPAATNPRTTVEKPDLSGEGGGRVLATDLLLGRLELSGEQLIAAAARPGGALGEYGLAVGSARGGALRLLTLGAATLEDQRAPFPLGDLAVQP